MTRKQFIAKYSGGHFGDAKSLEQKLAELAGLAFDAVNPSPVLLTDDYTLTAEDSGKLFVQTVDAKTISLPAGAEGLNYSFANGGANGAVLLSIDPNGTEKIFGTTNASTNVALSQAAGKKLLNTKATAICGDTVKLTWVTGIGWFASNFGGIWASEA